MNDLDLDDLLHIAERTLGEVQVRDQGLLASAAARPQASACGQDAYPTPYEKAAALPAFLGLQDLRLTLDNAGAYDLVIAVAAGELADVAAIAAQLTVATEPWAPSSGA